LLVVAAAAAIIATTTTTTTAATSDFHLAYRFSRVIGLPQIRPLGPQKRPFVIVEAGLCAEHIPFISPQNSDT